MIALEASISKLPECIRDKTEKLWHELENQVREIRQRSDTSGSDLAMLRWLKSENGELWERIGKLKTDLEKYRDLSVRHSDLGQPIKDSVLFRAYCTICDSPIRMMPDSLDDLVCACCSNCPGTVRDRVQAWERESIQFKLGRRHTDGG